MYVRFVIGKHDDQSHAEQGVFQAAITLRDSGQLLAHEEEWLAEALNWLNMHLPAPACLREPGNRRAISWFHPRAKKAIERVRSIAALLSEKGVLVRMLTTRDPGIVVYQDGSQVVAKPRRRPAGRVIRTRRKR